MIFYRLFTRLGSAPPVGFAGDRYRVCRCERPGPTWDEWTGVRWCGLCGGVTRRRAKVPSDA